MRSEYFLDPAKGAKLEQLPGLETTVLTGLSGERVMMALNATLPGHSVPLHSHPHEQLGVIYRGKGRLRIGEEERVVGPGDLYYIPPGVPHGDTCLGDEPFVMLDFFPIREDLVLRVTRGEEGKEEEEAPSSLIIREATEADLEAAVGLVRELAEELADREGLDPSGVRERFPEALSDARSCVLVAELEGEVVGLTHVQLRRLLLHRGPSGVIEELVVSKRHRGRGVGRHLLSAAIAWCRERGCAEVEVSTEWGNAAGLALYRGLGFTERGIWLEREV